MEQSNILLYFLAGVAGLFALLVIVYLVIRKKLQSFGDARITETEGRNTSKKAYIWNTIPKIICKIY